MRSLLSLIVPLLVLCLVVNCPALGAGGGFRNVSNTVLSSQFEQFGGQTASPTPPLPANAPLDGRTVFETRTIEVQVSVDVTNGGRPVKGLTSHDFAVRDNGQPQRILELAHDSAPLDIVLLLDVSGSVHRYLTAISAISHSALKKLQPSDRVAVMIFSRDSLVEQRFTNSTSEIEAAIEKASGAEPPGSGTRIYSAVAQAAHYLSQESSGGLRRRAILIVTDNDGLSYNMRQDRVLRLLYDGNITLDALVIGRHPHPPEPSLGSVINPNFAFDDVFLLAERTGGEAVPAKKPRRNLADLLVRVRERYLLVYHPPPTAVSGSFRNIHVELSPAARQRFTRAIVVSRSGYYVNGPAPAREGARQ